MVAWPVVVNRMIALLPAAATQREFERPDAICNWAPWSVGPVQMVILAPLEVVVEAVQTSWTGTGLAVEQASAGCHAIDAAPAAPMQTALRNQHLDFVAIWI